MKFEFSVVVTVPDAWVETVPDLPPELRPYWCANRLRAALEAVALNLPVKPGDETSVSVVWLPPAKSARRPWWRRLLGIGW